MLPPGSRSCDWLLFVIAMRAPGAPLTKPMGSIKHLGMGQKLSNIHWLVDNTMIMCESYLTKTYWKISGASSCRCIGITGRVRYNQGSFTQVLGKSLVIC